MRNVARLPDSDRGELFRNTADKMGLNDAIVEKDFWVCFTLDHLFHRCPWKDAITFKGGTSLSKAFNLISRFARVDLLKTVVDFKMKFYPRSWAKYQEAVPGTLKLVPPDYRFAALAADYEAMKDMLYGDVPSFYTVMDALRNLERGIHLL